jgi:hypothetical protein
LSTARRYGVPRPWQNVLRSVLQVVPSRTANPHTPPKIGRQMHVGLVVSSG